MRLLSEWNALLWNAVLPVMLPLTAVICAVRLRGRPVRGAGRFCAAAVSQLTKKSSAAAAQRRTSAAALAAVMGTGNLVGTAYALQSGGAGAIFWLLGMVLVYAENLLGMRWSTVRRDGVRIAGTFAMLRLGLHSRVCAAVFAVGCACAGLGMGDLAQSSTVALTAAEYGIPPALAGLAAALLLCGILLRGQKGIESVSARLMPLICLIYLLGCGVLLIRSRSEIPAALCSILREAFGIRAAGSGISAGVLLQGLSVGLRRGIFSTEAGLGSSALLHMHAQERDGAVQGRWASLEVFADTVLCCTLTALVILTAPNRPLCSAPNGAAVLLSAFSSGLGKYAGGFLAVCMVLLAFATQLGWFPCGVSAAEYLGGKNAGQCYLALYVLLAFAGAFGSPEWVWAVCDCCNGMMALPNLCGLLLLSGRLRECENNREGKMRWDGSCRL